MEPKKQLTEVENNIADILIEHTKQYFAINGIYEVTKFGNSIILESSYLKIEFQILNNKIIHVQKFMFKTNIFSSSKAMSCLEELDDSINTSSNFFGLREGALLIF